MIDYVKSITSAQQSWHPEDAVEDGLPLKNPRRTPHARADRHARTQTHHLFVTSECTRGTRVQKGYRTRRRGGCRVYLMCVWACVVYVRTCCTRATNNRPRDDRLGLHTTAQRQTRDSLSKAKQAQSKAAQSLSLLSTRLRELDTGRLALPLHKD